MAVRTQYLRKALLSLALIAGPALADPGLAQHRPGSEPGSHRAREDRSRPGRFGADDGRPARNRPEQDAAFQMRRSGAIRSLSDIEGRVIPRMGGASYLGPELDTGTGTYRLKFMRGGSVIWVDVDARTGAIIGRSGR
ncbi:PepSY domain-containing protein [Sphingomonas sp. ID0503]|uniref:PepSY domain-containing protein n=1 Tax=Sphingomonas sp. ID0503 TaxID=3399691 RepID=UPI003AFAC7A5